MEKGTKENLPCLDKLNTEFPEACLYGNILYQTSGSDTINVKLLLRMPYIFYCKAIYVWRCYWICCLLSILSIEIQF